MWGNFIGRSETHFGANFTSVKASGNYNILIATKESNVEECRRYNFYIGKGNEARQALGVFISIKEELKFRDNLTCFAWFLDVISSSVINDHIKKKIYFSGKLREMFHEQNFYKYHRQCTNE